MAKLYSNRFGHSALLTAFVLAAAAAAAACSFEAGSAMGPRAGASGAVGAMAATTSTTYSLSSVTPPINCVDASGAVTTVTGGTLALSSNGRFTATFQTQTTDGSTTTAGSRTEKGTFTVNGSTIVFKTGGETLTGTISDGSITIADYPFCGEAHTAVFDRV